MEKILNKYLKIQPITYDSFVSTDKQSYEEIGIVLNKDESIDIPIGARVWFDSFMCKKYPVQGKQDEWEWFVAYDEIVKVEYNEKI